MELYQGDASYESLGGLDALKSFCKRALTRSNERVRARGVMLLSPPGCGKSQICKALGNETGRPVILLNVGSLMGSLVGQTEQRTRQALQIIDAMGKSVVLLDEVDKAFGGGTSGSGDSGVSSRLFGTFLTWLQERKSDSFVVCTANDVEKLPPEFARAESFDSVFFVDLPAAQQRALIWDQYIGEYDLDAAQAKPKDDLWTGAEIKACCRLSALLDVPLKQAAQNVVPVAVTASESIANLRKWASGRCIDAQQGGIFKVRKPKSGSRRKVQSAPSLN
jgi:SpoVK/Ycf46/Vps4 family AAA+-type ATPase